MGWYADCSEVWESSLIIYIYYSFHSNTLIMYDIIYIIIILSPIYILSIMYNLYFIIILYIDMSSIIVHITCIHHYNVCDSYINCILLFHLNMQYHYIAFVLSSLEDYTSSCYVLH